MIKPVNNSVLIEPLEHEEFISSSKSSYEEIGIVIDVDPPLKDHPAVQKGNRVFFDSWLAAKFPKGEGEFYWLVPYDSIKAYEIPTE